MVISWLTRAAIASSVAQALAALSSESPQAQMIVARLALAAGDQVVADEAIERTLELAPDDPDARLMRAQQQANAGDMEAALLTIAEARERSPDNTQLQLGEAQLLIEAGRIEEATSALKLIGDSLLGARAQANPEALLTVGMLSMQVGALTRR